MNQDSITNESQAENMTPWVSPDIAVQPEPPRLEFTVTGFGPGLLSVIAFDSGLAQPLFSANNTAGQLYHQGVYELPRCDSNLYYRMIGVDSLTGILTSQNQKGQKVLTYQYGTSPASTVPGATIEITIVVQAGTIFDPPLI